MRSRWSLGAVGLSALLWAGSAEAFCGFYVSGADAKLYNNATQVVLLRDGTRTVLSMQNNYQGPPEAFAMVVPVPIVLQKENVKTLVRDVFDRIDQLSAPRLVEYWEQDPCDHPRSRSWVQTERRASAEAPSPAGGGPGGAPLVRIEAQFAVGEYEIVVLSAEDSSALDTWLRQSGYHIPDGAEPVLRPYVQRGEKFFVAKVDPEKVKFDAKGMATLSPLRFHYDTETFALPVRLGLLNSKGTQDLIVHVLAKNQRYEAANYPNLTIPTNIELNESALGAFGSFYVALFDQTVAKKPGAVVTEYAWSAGKCDPCPGPTLAPEDIAALGGDTLVSPRDTDQPPGSPPASGMSPAEATITRLHVRYTKESLGEDLVLRSASPITGGNEWSRGPDKHGATSDAPGGQNMFQGRYIVRHPWKGDITCTDPVYGRWGERPDKVGAARDLAFVPREGLALSELVAENVESIGLLGSPPTIERNVRVPLSAYLRTSGAAIGFGFAAGLGLVGFLLYRMRRAS
ncbi:DUF2330 domain-containing protein [Polyangium sp. 6x1]|uniref:DUF2330 domain-containing protein n=1 Tax=Polyangium sp. 6x1 TaxID=3042689 RepID=UPI002482B23F|nr:DUF2330 domain-containing protein [Polyangium sp. 6x1]MDI1444130.1 DUF2330 domain-containing protein [Polyangium sp. 6x1]